MVRVLVSNFLVDHHVHMKPTVADEVDKLLRRSNVGHKAQ